MSTHRTALIPLEAWCYSSPDVRDSGQRVDFGLLAEALIYYDCLLVNISNQPQLADFLRWLVNTSLDNS